MLGDADQLETEYMLAEQDKIVDERELFGCENLTVRIRYRSRPIFRVRDERWKTDVCWSVSSKRPRPLLPDNLLCFMMEDGCWEELSSLPKEESGW